MDIKSQKNEMRTYHRSVEAALSYDYKVQCDSAIVDRTISLPEYEFASTVLAFVGTSYEINTVPLLKKILQDGKRLCLPRCVGSGTMIFKYVSDLSVLSKGKFNIPEPPESCETVSLKAIDFAVIPRMSCTRSGDRLGHGGGYYDRFLAEYTGSAVLICRELHISDSIPIEPHDMKIPIVVTEKGIFRVNE